MNLKNIKIEKLLKFNFVVTTIVSFITILFGIFAILVVSNRGFGMVFFSYKLIFWFPNVILAIPLIFVIFPNFLSSSLLRKIGMELKNIKYIKFLYLIYLILLSLFSVISLNIIFDNFMRSIERGVFF